MSEANVGTAETFPKAQVRKWIYEAYKAGQGDYTTGPGYSRLSVQNFRLAFLRRRFPQVFDEKRKTHEEAKKASTLSVLKTPRWRHPKWFDKFIESIEPFRGASPSRRRAGIDHIRGYKNVAILQPYHAYGDELFALLSACKEHGLKTLFSGMTNHYPGATFTIVIYHPADEEQAMEFTHEAIRTDIEVPEGIPL